MEGCRRLRWTIKVSDNVVESFYSIVWKENSPLPGYGPSPRACVQATERLPKKVVAYKKIVYTMVPYPHRLRWFAIVPTLQKRRILTRLMEIVLSQVMWVLVHYYILRTDNWQEGFRTIKGIKGQVRGVVYYLARMMYSISSQEFLAGFSTSLAKLARYSTSLARFSTPFSTAKAAKEVENLANEVENLANEVENLANKVQNLANEVHNLANEVQNLNLASNFWLDSIPHWLIG